MFMFRHQTINLISLTLHDLPVILDVSPDLLSSFYQIVFDLHHLVFIYECFGLIQPDLSIIQILILFSFSKYFPFIISKNGYRKNGIFPFL